MKLQTLLQGIEQRWLAGTPEAEVTGMTSRAQEVSPGDLFVAYRGVSHDGHDYLGEAIERGAAACLVEALPKGISTDGLSIVQVTNGRTALALASANLYGRPAERVRLTGITGTNGKTSTAYMVHRILHVAGHHVGLISTIQYGCEGAWHTAQATTPDALQLQSILAELVENEVESVVMEVTSHALAQQRVAGILFDVVAFTNLTQDHLDYHRSMKAYLDAKLQLFRQVRREKGWAILNADEPATEQIRREIHVPVVSYGMDPQADFHAGNIRFYPRGIRFEAETPDGILDIQLPLLGAYNVSNALAAIAVASVWNVPLEAVRQGLAETTVPGRFEQVDCGQPFNVVVDYAHTPDALARVLTEARRFTEKQVLCVFGCGGDRDRDKRPKMGILAVERADYTVITSDNPRTEVPEAIIEDILAGIAGADADDRYCVQLDRRAAIGQALAKAKRGDIVVIAGKGHEDYQILGSNRIHFDDREVAASFLCSKGTSPEVS